MSDAADQAIKSNAVSSPEVQAAAETMLDIARGRREILRQMRVALLANDSREVLRCARRLTGVDDEEDDRANSGLH